MDSWNTLLLTAGGVAALAGLLYAVRRGARRRRPGDPLGAFLRHFEAQGVPPELAHAAYDELRGWLGAAGSHRVAPQDDLLHVYGVEASERREAVELVTRACRRELPSGLAIPDELTSVDDLVRFVARCPQRSGS